MLKAFLPPIIGIRYFFIRKTSREKTHGHYLACPLSVFIQPFQIPQIFTVHSHNQVKLFQILFPQGARLKPRILISVFFQRRQHPAIRRAAPMVTDHSGGIALNQMFQTLFCDHFFENDFRGRRAADVAQTDKQDSVRFGSTHGRHFFFRIGRRPPHFKREEFLHGKRKRPRIWHGAEKETAPLIQK